MSICGLSRGDQIAFSLALPWSCRMLPASQCTAGMEPSRGKGATSNGRAPVRGNPVYGSSILSLPWRTMLLDIPTFTRSRPRRGCLCHRCRAGAIGGSLGRVISNGRRPWSDPSMESASQGGGVARSGRFELVARGGGRRAPTVVVTAQRRERKCF